MTESRRQTRDVPESGTDWGEVDLSSERPIVSSDDRVGRRMLFMATAMASALLAGVVVYASARPGSAASRLSPGVGPAVAGLTVELAAQDSLAALKQAADQVEPNRRVAHASVRDEPRAAPEPTPRPSSTRSTDVPPAPANRPPSGDSSKPAPTADEPAGDGTLYDDLPTLDDLPSGADIFAPEDLVGPGNDAPATDEGSEQTEPAEPTPAEPTDAPAADAGPAGTTQHPEAVPAVDAEPPGEPATHAAKTDVPPAASASADPSA